ncbi:hypothetical protein J5Y09_05225 [Roseomonas sp. PWR1]|uniref:Uncharacterized protein n=1 Tax=Roseomonas nitratireducens TaxID=2820810 RepID=A0ABS4AR24_9PROT|nr:hypothetical protein [Neoroseomonas nitratireducens]MBP0463303.1 hypothetical protein [Neoroseomonas nitratireducens]
MSDDPARALGALYPSTIKPDATAATPASAPTKAAASPATSPAPAAPAPAAQPAKATWQAPDGAQPAKAAQVDPPRDPATLFVEPVKTYADVVAATPLPEGDADAHGLDMGEEGKAAREAVRSAFLASGASAAETSELWGIAVEAARPDAAMPDHDAARAELMAAWGDNYTARLASVRTFFKGVAQKHPAVASEVLKLGLDNSPRFLMALHKAAQRRGR